MNYILQANGQSKIKLDSLVYHLGEFEEGPSIVYKIKWKNIGTKPVFVTNAVECGGVGVCVYPKDSVFPKQKSYITWHHPTLGRVGNNSKEVTIMFKDTTYSIRMMWKVLPMSNRRKDSLNNLHQTEIIKH